MMIEVMKEAALAAGSYMLNSDEREQTNKTNTKDFVTVADIKSQDIIRDKLRQKFPDTIILSEEDTEEERRQLYVSGYTGFVLDPIDGTYNFKRAMKESIKKVEKAAKTNKEDAKKMLPLAYAAIDKAAKKGVIKNTTKQAKNYGFFVAQIGIYTKKHIK